MEHMLTYFLYKSVRLTVFANITLILMVSKCINLLLELFVTHALHMNYTAQHVACFAMHTISASHYALAEIQSLISRAKMK
jgi:hypothetical protein